MIQKFSISEKRIKISERKENNEKYRNVVHFLIEYK